ncbi:MAG: discoidin domain-containing protein [Clostridiales bacterium]|jgi:hypothetical protein|nr:discoidin domain-containing protein [Clostridiales bacterium]
MTKRRKALAAVLALAIVFAGLVMPEGGVTLSALAVGEQPLRQEIDFNAGWKYRAGANSGAEAVSYDDSGWASVAMPHSTDYVTYGDIGNYNGVAWYRKSFTLPENLDGKQIFINIGAAMQYCEVYLNGTSIGTHMGGFMRFTFDLTAVTGANKLLYSADGPNVIAVRIDTTRASGPQVTKDPADFKFHGGIYRDVTLTVTEKVHITDPIFANAAGSGGVFIHSDTATSYSGGAANFGITGVSGTALTGFTGNVAFWVGTHVKNDGASSQSVSVRTEIFEKGGSSAVYTNTTAASAIAAGASYQFAQTGSITGARLWHPNSPNLYEVRTTVLIDGAAVDHYFTTTGFRSIVWGNATSSVKGTITINGEAWQGRATNTHQEIGMVGFAVPADAARDEVRLIKDAGFDAVRLAHYPYSEAFLSACDEYGLLVQEPITGWQASSNDFTVTEAKDMMRRDRNHPAIALWELDNNEGSTGNAATLVANAKLEFPTKQMVTTGNTGSVDVRYVHSKSENGFTTGKPNLYYEDGDWAYGGYASSSRHLRWVSNEAYLRQKVANYQASLDWDQSSTRNLGYYWVWQDYTGFGEGNPASATTGSGSKSYENYPTPCGLVDMYRIANYAYYYAQSQRDPALDLSALEGVRSGPMIYIATRWFDTSSGAATDVPVYTNCASVELYGATTVGGALTRLGTGKTAADTQHSAHNNGTSYAMTTAYAGTDYKPWTFTGISHTYVQLIARGYDAGGKQIAEYTVTDPRATSASNVRLTWQSDWRSGGTPASPSTVRPMANDGGDKRLVYIDITDANGNIITNSGTTADSITMSAPTTGANLVTVTVSGGDAWILGGETANSPGVKSATITPRGGQVSVWIVGGTQAGAITVSASSSGLSSDTLTISVEDKTRLENDIYYSTELWTDGAPIPSPSPPPEPTFDPGADDHCLAKTEGVASASSGTASAANDGVDATVWTADNGNAGQYWQVDLRDLYDISDIEILWAEPSAYKYWMRYSADGVSWLPLEDMTGNAASEERAEFAYIGSARKSARFIRISFIEASVSAFAIAEVHVNGQASSGAASVDYAEGKPSWAVGLAAGSEARFGNNGSPGDFMTMADAGAGNKWWVDMEGFYDISSVGITWEETAAHKYKLEVSRDGETWRTVLYKNRNTESAKLSSDAFSPAIQSVRFVRVTSAPDSQPMSFSMLAVTGSPAADLAFAKEPAQSGSNMPGRQPVWATDNDGSTYWQPSEAGQSLTVDVGDTYYVHGVTVAWPGGGSHACALQGSADGAAWYTYYEGADSGPSSVVSALMADTRYIRVVDNTGDGVASLEIYGQRITPLSPYVGDNVLTNPSFASLAGTSDTNDIPGWTKLDSTDTAAVYGATRSDANPPGNEDRYAFFRNTGGGYSASLYQAVEGLPEGIYEFSGWFKRGPSGTNPLELYAFVENYGAETETADLLADVSAAGQTYAQATAAATSVNYAWTKITIPNIRVTNGRAAVGVFANADSADSYVLIDELSLKLVALDPPKAVSGYTGLLYISKNGTDVVGDYAARNNGAVSGVWACWLAEYDGERLTRLSKAEGDSALSLADWETLTLPDYDAAKTYKAYLWDGATYMPITAEESLSIKSVDELKYSIDQGGTVALPPTVGVRYNNGPRGADTASAAWGTVPAFNQGGKFTVNGVVDGTSIPAVATVTVKGDNLLSSNNSTLNATGSNWTFSAGSFSRATSANETGGSGGAIKYWVVGGNNTCNAHLTMTLDAGVYVFGFKTRSGAFTGSEFQAYATVGSVTTDADIIAFGTGNGSNKNDHWTYQEMEFTVPAGSASVTFGIRANAANSQAWGQWDDFTLNKIG